MKINFRTHQDQVAWSPINQADVTVRWMGRCELCGSNTYDFVGFDTDPRGPLGMNHTYDPFRAKECGYIGPDVAFCWGCKSNDGDLNKRAFAIAVKKWSKA